MRDSFTSGAAAEAWFTDKTENLGALPAGQTLASRSADDRDHDAAGSEFFGNLLIGNVSPPATTSAPARFAQALAGVGAQDQTAITSEREAERAAHVALVAPRPASWA